MAQIKERGSISTTVIEASVNKLFLGSATAVNSFNHFGIVDVELKKDFTQVDRVQFWTSRLVDLSPIGWDLVLGSTREQLLCVPKGGSFLRRLFSTKIIGSEDLKPISDYGIKEVDDEGYLLEKKSEGSVPLTIDVAFDKVERNVKVRLEDPSYKGREVMFIPFLIGGQFIGEVKRRFTLNELNMPVWKSEGSTIPDCMVLDLFTKKQIRRRMELVEANSEVIGIYP